MKDLNKLFDECKAELDSIGIQYGNVVSIEVNYRAKKQCGLCREVRIGRLGKITVILLIFFLSFSG